MWRWAGGVTSPPSIMKAPPVRPCSALLGHSVWIRVERSSQMLIATPMASPPRQGPEPRDESPNVSPSAGKWHRGGGPGGVQGAVW